MPRYMWDGERRMGRTLRSWAGRSKKKRSARRRQRRRAGHGGGRKGQKGHASEMGTEARGKASSWQNVLIENEEAQPGWKNA